MMNVPSEEIKAISIDEIDLRYSELRLPCPVRLSRLRRLGECDGMRSPVLLSSSVVRGRLVLVDGFKRLEIARDLGEREILGRVVDLDAVAAEIAIINSNESQRGLLDIEEGLIVQSLHRRHGRSQVEIAELLGRHKSWVCRRLRLVEGLDASVQRDLRLGLISASVAREVVRLPRGNQSKTVKAIIEHGLSSRQAKRLVDVLNAADPSNRRSILCNPLDHLPQEDLEERVQSDPRLSGPGNQVRQQVLRLGSTSNRLIELLRTHETFQFQNGEMKILRRLAKPILSTSRKAMGRVDSFLQSKTDVCDDQ